MGNDMDQKVVNVIKGLVMDTVCKANSGHPGGAMSSTDFTYVLFSEFLNFDPDDASWFNRDRFVLSAGHESALLYSMLHLCGFLGLDDLKAFRQMDSRTPGHPEIGVAPGVEATTGPLGQGFAMAVGMAATEAFLGQKLGRETVDHFTYVLASDGDLQEPVVHGAASLAGLWKLGKLIVLYDSNKIQLAGPTSRCDGADQAKVFEGLGWQVLDIDGHDRDAIRKAITGGRLESSKPTLIICNTVMAKGAATKEGDHNTHGCPLPVDEISATKKKIGLPEDDFYVPEDAVAHFRARFDGLRQNVLDWRNGLENRLSDAGFAKDWKMVNSSREELALEWPEFEPGQKMATRKAWGACLDKITDQLPNLVGGSADLDPSNQTAKFRQDKGDFGIDGYGARNMAFGVREFPMAAILNGMALHGGVIPFGATFLTFSDYCRNAMRMSALQELPVLYVYTHDSFYVGEDGPTHQPIEHVASLRLIPNLLDLRPADANETAVCLDVALRQKDRPSSIFLTRQGLPVLDPKEYPAVKDGPRKGGYVLKDCGGTPDLIILASGSEVSMALEAAAMLEDKKVRVVSMPSMALFEEQSEEYKSRVLPSEVRTRVAAEAGRPECWYKYVGLDGFVLGMESFGQSAPAGELAVKYGFTADNLARMIRDRF